MGDPVANLDRMDALAEATEGFIWRLHSDDGNATDVCPLGEPTSVNVSVWHDVARRNRVHDGVHVGMKRQRRKRFERMGVSLWCRGGCRAAMGRRSRKR